MKKIALGALACIALAVLSATPAAARPGGSYQRTCMRIDYDGSTLTAQCQRRDGSMADASLPYAARCPAGVSNQDGVLRCEGYNPVGSYTRTCTRASTPYSTMTAQCQTRDGGWNETSLDDVWSCNGMISNQDGELQCDGN